MKALALLSGGLDSILATRLLQEQGLDVTAVNFASPFCASGKDGFGVVDVSRQLKIPLRVVNMGEDYLRIVRNPKYGYGANMNPCIDCRIFILRRAREYADKIGVSFIFTGEVLDERPMSQHLKALKIVEKEAGLERRVLRPLSAKLLPKTEAEMKGWVDRERLMDIRGRSRKRQILLARELGVEGYPSPAGGCLLTCREFAAKLRDLFEHKKKVGVKDVKLLKIGRHFRMGRNKIIVGRNEAENHLLKELQGKRDYLLEVPDCGSPTTLLQGPKTENALNVAAALTLRYSDNREETASVSFRSGGTDKAIVSARLHDRQIESLRIRWPQRT